MAGLQSPPRSGHGSAPEAMTLRDSPPSRTVQAAAEGPDASQLERAFELQSLLPGWTGLSGAWAPLNNFCRILLLSSPFPGACLPRAPQKQPQHISATSGQLPGDPAWDSKMESVHPRRVLDALRDNAGGTAKTQRQTREEARGPPRGPGRRRPPSVQGGRVPGPRVLPGERTGWAGDASLVGGTLTCAHTPMAAGAALQAQGIGTTPSTCGKETHRPAAQRRCWARLFSHQVSEQPCRLERRANHHPHLLGPQSPGCRSPLAAWGARSL